MTNGKATVTDTHPRDVDAATTRRHTGILQALREARGNVADCERILRQRLASDADRLLLVQSNLLYWETRVRELEHEARGV